MAQLMHSKFMVPGFGLLMGVVLLAAAVIGHQASVGFLMFGLMAAFSIAILLGGRSETVRGLRGDGRDERFAMLDLKATAAAGSAVIIAVILAFIWQIAHGGSGMPYGWLGAVAGLAYLVAVLYLRFVV